MLFLIQAIFQRAANRKKVLCVAIMLLVFVVSAMKEITQYPDLVGYTSRYYQLSGMSFRSLLSSWLHGSMKDVGFYFVAKVFADLGANVYVWMGFIALLYAAGFSFLIYRHSDQPFLSILFLVALYYRFTLSGLRQTMVLALVLIAYHYIVERKLVPYLILIGIAFFFHSSVLIFLPAYWIADLRLDLKQVLLIAAAMAVVLFAPGLYRLWVSEYAWHSSMADYSDSSTTLSWAGYIIQLFILLFCVFFRSGSTLDRTLRKTKADCFINLMIVGLFLQSFTVIIAESFRMSYYYSMGCFAAVPNIIASQKKTQNRGLLYLAVGSCLVAYSLLGGGFGDMKFFWQVQ